jgi:Tol biopolymer transport system component
VAFDRRDPQTGNFDIWLHDIARGAESRFTFGPASNQFPVWSPDGTRIVFYARLDGIMTLYQKAVGAAAKEEILHKDAKGRPTDWSRDGRYILEESPNGLQSLNDIWVFPLSGDRKPFPYLQSEFNENVATLSPNGQWIAYQSNESKQVQIYVQTFPTPGGKWQVSTNGGGLPRWSRDGRELFFLSLDGKMMASEIRSSGAKFEAGVPKPLFDVRRAGQWYDVSKDGRFLMATQVDSPEAAPLTVVLNWTAGLKK